MIHPDQLHIRDYSGEDFLWLRQVQEASFPSQECPTDEQMNLWFKRPYSRAFILELAEADAIRPVGFFLGADFDQFYFGEYLATIPEIRNCGLGQAFIERMKTACSDKPLIFECELPSDSDYARRRYNFYLRLGLWRYDYEYYMPALHPGDEPIAMCLMGGDMLFQQKELDEVVRTLYDNIYYHVMGLAENQRLIQILNKS